jgi:hypothetical protein
MQHVLKAVWQDGEFVMILRGSERSFSFLFWILRLVFNFLNQQYSCLLLRLCESLAVVGVGTLRSC